MPRTVFRTCATLATKVILSADHDFDVKKDIDGLSSVINGKNSMSGRPTKRFFFISWIQIVADVSI